MKSIRSFLVILVILTGAWLEAQGWDLKVTSLTRDGARIPDATLLVARGNQTKQESVKAGDVFPEGVVLAVPPRVTLTLASSNGNTLTLLPGTRLRLSAGSGKGEEYGLEEGTLRCIVKRALDFFNVRHDSFQAIVRGTEYSVEVKPGQEIRFEVSKGRVQVQHEAQILMAEKQRECILPVSEALGAGQSKSFRLDIPEYLAKFGHFGEAEAYYRNCLEADRASGDPERLLLGLNRLGILLNCLGRPREAMPFVEEHLALVHKAHPSGTHTEVAAALDLMGNTYMALGSNEDLRHAIALFEESLAISRKLFPEDRHDSIAQCLNRLGAAYRLLGGAQNLKRADEYFESSLRIYRELHPNGIHEGIAAVLTNRGNSLAEWGGRANLKRALTCFEESLAIFRQLPGEGMQLRLANTLLSLGGAYLDMGDPPNLKKAIATSEEALATYRKLFPNGIHDSIALVLSNIGTARARLGTPEELQRARQCQEEALAILRQLEPSGTSRGIAGALTNLSATYFLLGTLDGYKQGIALQEESLGVYRKLYPKGDSNDLAKVLTDLGTGYNMVGAMSGDRASFTRSIARFEEALGIYQKRFPTGQVVMVNILGGLAFDHVFTGEPAKAVAEAQKALAIAPDETWVLIVESHALILAGREEEARTLLLAHRKESVNGMPFREAVALDYAALRQAGINPPAFARMEKLLKD